MLFPARLTLLCLLLLPVSALRAGDTTFSDTRAVPRERYSPGPVSAAPSQPSEDRSDIDSHWEGEDDREYSVSPHAAGSKERFFSSCMEPGEMEGLKEVGGYLVTAPFRMGFCYLGYSMWRSHADLFAGGADMQALPERRWRAGIGFGFGALYMPGGAGGMPFSLHAELLHIHSPRVQGRLRLATFGAPAGALYDYERYVFVDGRPVGVQRDRIQSYSISGYPLLAEGLWSGARGLYLGAGGGAVLARESIGYLRSLGATAEGELRTETRRLILPAASLSVGRFSSLGMGGSLHRFEIRYQAMLHPPRHRTSFPGDNASVTHSLTWDWGWLW